MLLQYINPTPNMYVIIDCPGRANVTRYSGWIWWNCNTCMVVKFKESPPHVRLHATRNSTCPSDETHKLRIITMQNDEDFNPQICPDDAINECGWEFDSRELRVTKEEVTKTNPLGSTFAFLLSQVRGLMNSNEPTRHPKKLLSLVLTRY